MLRDGLNVRFKKNFYIKKKDFIRAGEAATQIKALLKSLNLDSALIRRVAICGYEDEMNVVMHGGDGVLSLRVDTDQLTLHISDNGPGIEDIELAMQKGFSTALDEYRKMGFGAGMGLPNLKKTRTRSRLSLKEERGHGSGWYFF